MDPFFNPDVFSQIQSYLTPYERIQGRSTQLFSPDEEAIYSVNAIAPIPYWVKKIRTGPMIKDEDIMHLDLEYLDLDKNDNVTDRAMLRFENLLVLKVGENTKITDQGLISPLVELEIPLSEKKRRTYTSQGWKFNFGNDIVPRISTLKILKLTSNATGIIDIGLLTNLRVLFVPDYTSDKQLENLKNLEELHLGSNGKITDEGILQLPKLKYLFVDRSEKITGKVTLSPSLKMIDLGDSKIRKKEILNPTLLVKRYNYLYKKTDLF